MRNAVQLVVVAALVAPGCYESHERPPPPCATVYVALEGSLEERTNELDLLLLVDNSNSMAGEQVLLGRELPRMFRALASGDLEGDGRPDFLPYESMHVGIVTSDMGAGPTPLPGADGHVPSCDPGFGDDGILRSAGASMAGCAAAYAPIFDFAAAEEPEAFAADVSCVALMGTGGCGFEQQLEAVLKSVSVSRPTAWTTPGYVAPVFAGGASPHGDGVNDGFLRASSTLAIVLLSDEEDCSVPDYSIFYRDPRFTSVGLNLRCFTFPEQLYPVSRYVDGLRSLRLTPSRLVFAAIVGVPPDLAGDTPAAYARMLADPRMIETPAPDASPPTHLSPSCETADGGVANAPRRIVAVADGLARAGATTTVQSICASDFGPAIERITTRIAEPGGCVPRAIDRAPDGTSACRLIERLPPASVSGITNACSTLRLARIGSERDEDGLEHELCLVPQIPASASVEHGGGGFGWYHAARGDTETCAGSLGGRVALSGTSAAVGATWYLACPHSEIEELDGSLPAAPLGAPCGARYAAFGAVDCTTTLVPSAADVDEDGAADRLACDLVSNTCVARCRSDADCEAAGLRRYRCDTRPLDVVLGADLLDEIPRNVCVRDFCE